MTAQPGAEEYQARLRQEIAHYKKIFHDRLFQQVPSIWTGAEERFCGKVHDATGAWGFADQIAQHFRGRSEIMLLGLGSGACGNELETIAPLLKVHGCHLRLTCVDINREILEQAAREAERRDVAFTPLVQDINQLSLDTGAYDVIVAFASLHHFMNLDHVIREVNRALRPEGMFLTIDIPTRNGYLMWPETLEVVNNLWKMLPPKYKFDHTHFETPTFIETYENIDYARTSFECINSEAILPALRTHLREIHYVPAFSIARRFFDTRFGPNYDIQLPLDKAIFEFVMNLDDYYLAGGILKPESFYGVYFPK
jgi:SAM-dependent methyltransferase